MNANEIAARTDARRNAKSPYPFLLVYSQKFTSGNLEGIEIVNDLPFCSEADALLWVKRINAKEASGKNNYRVTDHAVATM